MDQRPNFKFDYKQLKYSFKNVYESYSSDSSFFIKKRITDKKNKLSL